MNDIETTTTTAPVKKQRKARTTAVATCEPAPETAPEKGIWERVKEAAAAAAQAAVSALTACAKGACWLFGIEDANDAKALIGDLRAFLRKCLKMVGDTIAQQAGDVFIRLVVLRIVAASGATLNNFAAAAGAKPGPQGPGQEAPQWPDPARSARWAQPATEAEYE